jgi:MFS family permease
MPLPFGFPAAVWLLGLVSLLTDVASEAVYPLLPAFLTAVLGAGPAAIGIIEGVAESTASLLKLVSGGWSDRIGRRRPFVVLGYALSSLLRPLLALAGSWPHVLLLRFGDRIGKGLRSAPRDALLAMAAPPDRRGRVFGFHRAMDHAGAVFGPLLAAAFLWARPGDYRTLFLLTALPGIAVILMVVRVREADGGAAAKARVPASFGDWRSLDPSFRRYLGVLFLFTLGNSTDAFLLLRLAQEGIDVALLPILWAALHVVKSGLATAGGAFSDRFGRKTALLTGWLFYALVYLGFAFAGGATVLIALFLSYGLFYALTEGAERAVAADLVGPERLGLAYGFLNAALGFAALPASLLFGLLYQAAGTGAAFGFGAAMAAVAAALLASIRLKASPAPPAA